MIDEDAAPDVTVFGPGDADVAVVGCVHGNEPAGVRAMHRILQSDPEFRDAVKFIVANPPAAVANRRYLDVDMNRVFPGDLNAEDRERRLAAQLVDATEGCRTVSIHTTHATPEPVAFVTGGNPGALETASRLPIQYVVNEQPVVDTAFSRTEGVVSIEAGKPDRHDAAAKAEKLVRCFLEDEGVMDESPLAARDASPSYYQLVDTVEKPSDGKTYELIARNFERVDAGTAYARSEGGALIADEPFVPVLMSESGYSNIYGYRGRKVGDTAEEARDAWLDGDS